jgi:Cys-rich repeat protein
MGIGLSWLTVTRLASVLLLTTALLPLACATYREDLNRGQRMYEDNQYEHALALWRTLEDDADSLSANDQARYAYLRGMTDYRLGFRADSRHWLGIAKATDQTHGGGLSAEWKERLEQSLTDLNQDVYGGGERFDASSSRAVEYGKAAPGDDSAVPPTPPAPAPKPNGRCTSNAECPSGQICDGKYCSPL